MIYNILLYEYLGGVAITHKRRIWCAPMARSDIVDSIAYNISKITPHINKLRMHTI